MNVRFIPRTAITGYLRLVRLPLDAVVGLLPHDGSGAGASAELALDRTDASIRTVAGTILGDQVLLDDARRRRVAAEERRRALRLRGEAERESQEADSRLAERQERAERQRREAEERSRFGPH